MGGTRATLRTSLLLALLLLAAAGSAGCLGGEARSEWAFRRTQLADAHAAGLRGDGVVVAVLDTGINLRHPSLDHLRDGKRENGEVVAFRDFLGDAEGVEDAFDDDGHGSHVAGILSAKGSTFGDKVAYGGVDLLGGAPNVLLVIARVCDAESCSADALPAAVRWAVYQHNAQILSLSLGGVDGLPGVVSDVLRSDLENAIEDAARRGVVTVAAAGNDGAAAEDVRSPADYAIAIAVGAVGKDGQVASISNRGAADQRCTAGPIGLDSRTTGRCDPNKKPELVAPGVDILSAWKGDSYVRATGTSQAVPFVTAAVAVVLEDGPRLDGRDDVVRLKEALADTAAPVAGQRQPHDRAAGYGLVQAMAAREAFR